MGRLVIRIAKLHLVLSMAGVAFIACALAAYTWFELSSLLPLDSLSVAVVQRFVMFYAVFSIVVFVLLAIVVGALLYKAAGRLKAISAVAVELERGNSTARVPEEYTAEPGDIAEIGTRLNGIANVIQELGEKLRMQDESRRNLLVSISHELRTPMMIAQGCIETVLLNNADMTAAKREQYIQSALHEIANIDRLVQQLFELSALEVARDKAMHWENVPYDEFLYSVVMSHCDAAGQAGKTVEMIMPNRLPELRIDPRRIISVLDAMLANALRRPGGRIAVEASYDAVSNTITTSITGKSEADSFATASTPCSENSSAGKEPQKAASGTGPGLMLCRQIIELHGGTITMGDDPDAGAIAAFALPVVRLEEPALALSDRAVYGLQRCDTAREHSSAMG